MIVRNYFSHQIPPDGHTVFDVMSNAGYCYNLAGENIGWNNYPDDQATAEIQTMFMNSPDHRANILGPAWDVVGIGAYKGPDGKKMWAVVFADKCGSVAARHAQAQAEAEAPADQQAGPGQGQAEQRAKPEPKPKPDRQSDARARRPARASRPASSPAPAPSGEVAVAGGGTLLVSDPATLPGLLRIRSQRASPACSSATDARIAMALAAADP